MKTWNTDAQFSDSIDEKFLATNPQIDQFLSSGVHGKFILVAAKGMGKTLLLRHKRKQIENAHRDYFLIPRNETADYVRPPRSSSQGMTELMQTKDFWQDVWTLSIAISVLLNFPHNLSESEQESVLGEVDRAKLPVELAKELSNAFSKKHIIHRTPSEVLDIFLQCTVKAIERIRSHAITIVTSLVNRHIDSGCAVFIDSFDQAINDVFPNNLDIWCGGQGGLLKAAWELSRHNRHLRIYTTIRQEAFACFNDPEINNIRGSMLLIEYSKEDLHAIFSKAILHYESVDSIEEFVGLKQIYNGYLRIREPIFDYIYRHTIGIPRWFMCIGEKISATRQKRGVIADSEMSRKHQKLIANLINEESAKQAEEFLKSEMTPFFKGGAPEKFIEGILGQIGSTVLSLANLMRISEKFLSTDWAGTSHPFCLLYNFGLLGYVATNSTGRAPSQKFKKPYEFDWSYDNVLPKDPGTYYLVHPSLHDIIQKKNYRFKFNHIRISEGRPWGKKEKATIAKEMVQLFISYAHDNSDIVSGLADMIEEYLSVKSVLHDIWFDKWKMKAGKWFQDQMRDGLINSEYLILMVSKESLGSNAVAIEWKTKFADKLSKGEETVFPFIIDDTKFEDLPPFLKNIYSYRYNGNRDIVFRLVNDILFWKDEKVRG